MVAAFCRHSRVGGSPEIFKLQSAREDKVRRLLYKIYLFYCPVLSAFFLVLPLTVLFFVATSFDYGSKGSFPTFLTASLAACFSYQALQYTREKFRLDLFEKRYEVYLNIWTFLDFCIQMGRMGFLQDEINDNAHRLRCLSNDALYRIGSHKSRLLFGKEISDFLVAIRKVYAYWSSFPLTSENSEKKAQDMMFFVSSIENLPQIFAPYISFAEYRDKNATSFASSVVQKYREKENTSHG